MSPPNDEAPHQHRLREAGSKDVDWPVVVRASSLAERLRPMLSSDVVFVPLHYVVAPKECVVEVLADNVDMLRIDDDPREAAPASLSP